MKSASRLGLLLAFHLFFATTSHAQSVFISELADPRLNYLTDRFVEIYNPGPSPVDLSGWRLVAVGNSADIFTWNLSGTIQPGQALVAGDQTLVVAFPVDFPAEAWSESNSTWNGKVGDGAKLIDASSTIVDFVVVPGTAFENLDYVRKPTVTQPSTTYDANQWTATAIDFPTQGSPGSHSAGLSFPVISAIATSPISPVAGDAVVVSANVTDAAATLTAVELHWGLARGALSNTIAMSNTAGDTWTTDGSIPAQASGTTVYFEIEAFNDEPVSTVSQLQSYTISQYVAISAIQGQQAASPFVGTTVRTEGVVTAVYGGHYVIQDGAGAWSGIWVAGSVTPAIGDLLDVQGEVTESLGAGFEGTTFLSNAEILGSSVGSVPAPEQLSVAVAFAEAYEGTLVQVLDASCTDAELGEGRWQITDGSGTGRVGELGFDSIPFLGTRYDVTGPLLSSAGLLQLEPRSGADIVWSGDTFAPLLAAIEAPDLSTVRVTFTEPLDALTAENAAHYAIAGVTISAATLDASDASRVSLTTSGLSTGSYTLVVNGVEDLYGNVVSGASQGFDVNAYGPPAGYYSSATGLTGIALRSALHQIIDDHTSVSYSGTLAVFFTSDDKPNGKVWDMYSDTPGQTPPYEYTFGVDSGSSAGAEGQGYNREHSWPRSWFGGEVAPMNSDLFQLYPTDIYVNSIRGNFPYGEVSVPDYTSANGSKRGPNTYPGYSGTVFEPIDAYMGDFARSYFYMSARYYTEDGAWPSSEMTDGADLLPWAQAMLYEWHVADPVSNKERERNQVVFGYQGNRNPFIDHPEYVAAMFEIPTGIDADARSNFLLRANVPNPFSTATTIAFELARPQDVTLSIYDLRGRQVRSLISGRRDAGAHLLIWNGSDDAGRRVATGTYFYRLRAGEEVQTKSMILLR